MRKERLSIQLFGKTVFYTGLCIGVASAINLNIFFSFLRETGRWQTFEGDLMMLSPREFIYYNIFFAAISATVGFGLTIQFWFHNPLSFKLSRRWIDYIRTFSVFWLFVLLLLVFRLGTVLVLSLYDTYDYEDQLSFYRDFPLILILLPLVGFLNIWNPIVLKYRAGKWFWISFFAYCILTVSLGLNSPIDQSGINEAWKRKQAPYDAIVEEELRIANDKGIAISNQAACILKLKEKPAVYHLAASLKKSFASKEPIPIDSVVLELILVRRGTLAGLTTKCRVDIEELWPFALPRDVYYQIQISRDPVKSAYLNDLLSEYEEIFNFDYAHAVALDWPDEKYSNRNWMQRYYKEIAAETQKHLLLLKVE